MRGERWQVLICTDKGAHPSAQLARFGVVIDRDPMIVDLDWARGQRLAAINDGSLPTRTVDVEVIGSYNEARPDGTPSVTHADGRPVHAVVARHGFPRAMTKAGGGTTWHLKCPRCGRDWKIPEATLRRIGESPLNTVDLSLAPV